MNKELLEEAEKIWEHDDKIGKLERKFGFFPLNEAGILVERCLKLAEEIAHVDNPTSFSQLQANELKRKLSLRGNMLDHMLRGRGMTYEKTMESYGVDQSALDDILPWLKSNRNQVLEDMERVFQTINVEEYELSLPLDRPSVRRQAEEIAAGYIENYHQKLGRMLEEISSVGGFLRDIHAVPTTVENGRSYYDDLTQTLAIAIPVICYFAPDRTIHLRHREMLRLYGHEGAGHALNQVVTKLSSFPCFLSESRTATIATDESVAQFYERKIFEDLNNHTGTQKALSIAHEYGNIYEEQQMLDRIDTYRIRLSQYAITVLADKGMGDPKDPDVVKKRIDLITEVTLNPYYPRNIVNGSLDKYDHEGNLDAGMTSELRYAVPVVDRVLDIFNQSGVDLNTREGRSKFDEVLLKGFWTPQGMLENARVALLH